MIPPRCFSCSYSIETKYEQYLEYVQKEIKDEIAYNKLVEKNPAKKNVKREEEYKIFSPEGRALNTMNITRYCCRRMFLTSK